MGTRFPNIRLLGNKLLAMTHIRRAQTELLRTKWLAKRMGVHTYARQIQISDSVIARVGVYFGGGEYINIFAQTILTTPVVQVEEENVFEAGFIPFPLFSMNLSSSHPNLSFIVVKQASGFMVVIHDGILFYGSNALASDDNYVGNQSGLDAISWKNYHQNRVGDVVYTGLRIWAENFVYYNGYVLTEFSDVVVGAFSLSNYLVVLVESLQDDYYDGSILTVYTMLKPITDSTSTDYEFGNRVEESAWTVVDVNSNLPYDYTKYQNYNSLKNFALNQAKTEFTLRYQDRLITYLIEETDTLTITRQTPIFHATGGAREVVETLRTNPKYLDTNQQIFYDSSTPTPLQCKHELWDRIRNPAAIEFELFDMDSFLIGNFCAAFNYKDGVPQKIEVIEHNEIYHAQTIDNSINLSGPSGWAMIGSQPSYPFDRSGTEISPALMVKRGSGPYRDCTSETTVINMSNAGNTRLNIIGFTGGFFLRSAKEEWDGSASFQGDEKFIAPWLEGLNEPFFNWTQDNSGDIRWEGWGINSVAIKYYTFGCPEISPGNYPSTAVDWVPYYIEPTGSYSHNTTLSLFPFVDLEMNMRQEINVTIFSTHIAHGAAATEDIFNEAPYSGGHIPISELEPHEFTHKLVIKGKEFDIGFANVTSFEWLAPPNQAIYFGFYGFGLRDRNFHNPNVHYVEKLQDTLRYPVYFDVNYGSNMYVFKHPTKHIMFGGVKQYTENTEIQGHFLYAYDPIKEEITDLLPLMKAALSTYDPSATFVNLADFDFYGSQYYFFSYMETGKILGKLPDSVKI